MEKQFSISEPTTQTQTNRELRGPTLFFSYEELAVIAESGIAPEFMPRSCRQVAENETPAAAHLILLSYFIGCSIYIQQFRAEELKVLLYTPYICIYVCMYSCTCVYTPHAT